MKIKKIAKKMLENPDMKKILDMIVILKYRQDLMNKLKSNTNDIKELNAYYLKRRLLPFSMYEFATQFNNLKKTRTSYYKMLHNIKQQEKQIFKQK